MAKKRGSNEGSIISRTVITKDKNGIEQEYTYWMASVTIGTDPATGKQKRKTFSGKSRGEVAKKMTDALSKLQTGTYVEPTSLTLEKWLNDWLSGRKPHITENTYIGYETMIRRHIVPALGSVKLKNLTTRDIQGLLNSKLKDGRVDGQSGLSPRSVKYIYDTINTALEQAVKERIIPFNIADAVEIPKQVKREMKTMSQTEIATFFDTVMNFQLNNHHSSPLFAAFYLELATGIRRGELLGLHWTEVDFEKRRINIKTQLLRGKGRLYFSEPKTAKSKRAITLDPDVVEILLSHKRRQDKMKEVLGEAYQDHGLVFCTNDGKPIFPRNFTRHFELLLKKAGLDHYRFHDLRHTFATIGLENGIPAKTLQEMLGHSTFKTTMDTYSHVTPVMHHEAAQTIGKVLKDCIKK